MRSPELALAWDYWRRGMAGLLLTALGITVLPLYVYAAISWDAGPVPESQATVVLHVVFTLVMGFTAATAIFVALGSQTRFYVRPISTVRLVACQMGLAMASIAILYLVAATILNLGGAGWPLVGPAAFLATALACSLAAIWWLEGSFAQLVGCCGTLIPLVIWFNRCYGARIFGDWNRMWREPSASELLTLAALCLAAFGMAVAGVTRQRRGQVCDFAALRDWWEQTLASLHSSPDRFRSPLAAQVWCECRQGLSFAPPCLIALLIAVLIGTRLLGLQPSRTMVETVFLLPLGLLTYVMPLLFGLILGNGGTSNRMRGMTHTLATRPASDAFLANAMLINCALLILTSWLVAMLGVGLAIGLAFLLGDAADVYALYQHSFVTIALVAPACSWIFLGGMVSLVGTGRPWMWSWVLIAGCSLLGPFAVLNRTLSPPQLELLGRIMLLANGSAFLLGTMVAFTAAVRRKLVSANLARLCLGGWFLGAMVLVLVRPSQFFHEAVSVLALGIMALFFLPFASLPLAIRWNRHR